MRVLITGINGFAGGHLAQHLSAHPGIEIWGCGRSATLPGYLNQQAQYRRTDLRRPKAVLALLQTVRPAQIYHLAAQSFVPASWERPWDTLETNVRAQLNLFEAVRQLELDTRMLIVSSNEVYGRPDSPDKPIDETHPLWPKNPYAVSKATQDLLARQHAQYWGLHIVVARAFNHIGLRQNRRFVAPAFAHQVAAIESNVQPPVIKVGNLSARRDFTDVRDVVRAYALLMAHGEPGQAYNIGSGELRSIESILDVLLADSAVDIRIEIDPARLRSVTTPGIRANLEKLKAATSWEVQIPFETTIRDLLNYEREQVRLELEQTKH